MRRIASILLALSPGAAGAQQLGTAAQDGMTNLPPPELTESWTPVRKVTPGKTDSAPPSDAVVLFDGRDQRAWRSLPGGGPSPWKVEDGELVIVPRSGDIRTAEEFSSAQIHLEWRAPAMADGARGQDRANSGIYVQGRYEVQILDSYTNTTYSNGQAGAIYKQYAPLVNPARPTADWQSLDIVFTAPRFDPAGKLQSPARMTVLMNGVLVQNGAEVKGSTVFRGPSSYTAHGPGPLVLQDHHTHAVHFRNIWARRLD